MTDRTEKKIYIPDITKTADYLSQPEIKDPIFVVIKQTVNSNMLDKNKVFIPQEWTSTQNQKTYTFRMTLTRCQKQKNNNQNNYHIHITKEHDGQIIDTLEEDVDSKYNVDTKITNITDKSPATHLKDAVKTQQSREYFVFYATDSETIASQITKDYTISTAYTQNTYSILKTNKLKLTDNKLILLPYQNGNGICICNIEDTTTVTFRNSKWNIQHDRILRSFATLCLSEASTAYRYVRKQFVPCEIWDVLNINTLMFNNGVDYHTDNLLAWLQSNAPGFLKHSNFVNFVLNTKPTADQKIPVSANFTILILMLWYFPPIALLMSMGDYSIVHTITDTITTTQNKNSIKSAILDARPLFNENATEGNKALILPKHITTYLSQREAELPFYKIWAHIVTSLPSLKEKSAFEKFIQDPIFLEMTEYYDEYKMLKDIAALFNYGYTNSPRKLFKYLMQQTARSDNQLLNRTIQLMTDYLEMCDLLDITIDFYPQNLEQTHNKLMVERNKKITNNSDLILDRLATFCEKAVAAQNIKQDPFCVIFPHSSKDFLNEGQQMHNCVGGYYRPVAEGEKIIFFIRYLTNPDTSYVTAEYRVRDKELGQIYMARNTPVHSKVVLEFANKIVNALKHIKITI